MKTKPIFLIIAFILISITGANTQKLPNIQMVGVRAPLNAKADGKPIEWNNQFQAHNTGKRCKRYQYHNLKFTQKYPHTDLWGEYTLVHKIINLLIHLVLIPGSCCLILTV